MPPTGSASHTRPTLLLPRIVNTEITKPTEKTPVVVPDREERRRPAGDIRLRENEAEAQEEFGRIFFAVSVRSVLKNT
jgi:hypothetical protein